jgi:hypothetical protein
MVDKSTAFSVHGFGFAGHPANARFPVVRCFHLRARASHDHFENSVFPVAYELPPRNGWWRPKITEPARAAVFNFTNPAAPTASSLISLTAKEAVNLKSVEASAGLVIFGFGRESGVDISEKLQSHAHRLGILDLQNPSTPVLRPNIDLPGRLAAVSDISRTGCLVWSDSWNTSTQSLELQVSACDLSDVYKITAIQRPTAFSVLNRDIFTAQFCVHQTPTLVGCRNFPKNRRTPA